MAFPVWLGQRHTKSVGDGDDESGRVPNAWKESEAASNMSLRAFQETIPPETLDTHLAVSQIARRREGTSRIWRR